MTPCMDFSDQLREPFCNPAKDEKGRLRPSAASVVSCLLSVVGIEKVKEAMDVLFNAQFTGGPGGEGDVWFEVLNLEPILYVDG